MIIGFDPGAHGAIALIALDTGKLVDVFDMPSIEVKIGKTKRHRVSPALLSDLLRSLLWTHAYLEQVSAAPGQGVSSMFAFGRSLGVVEGVVAGLGVPLTMVTPQSWKRAMQVTSDKGLCRARAAQLFPDKASLFARVKDDGRAEAALLALYGWQKLRGDRV